MDGYEVKDYKLHVPSLDEVADLFRSHLSDYFKQVTVTVQECPDLSKDPFHLTQSGLNGRPSVCDVGGVPNLVPLAKVEKAPYNIPQILSRLGYAKEGGFAIGAAGGPHHIMGMNCEGMPNVSIHDLNVVTNESYCAKLDPNTETGYKLIKLTGKDDEASFCLLGNLFVSEGKPGPVIKVSVKERLKEGTNFIGILRSILNSKYNSTNGTTVSMGGVFLIKSGRAKLHIMPDFSTTPLNSDDDVNSWLKYFEMKAPLVCLTVFHSQDPGLDLRIEHTHCFSQHGDGGHYHYDTTPDIVEYEGYFNVAHVIHRIDAPKETHNIGRD